MLIHTSISPLELDIDLPPLEDTVHPYSAEEFNKMTTEIAQSGGDEEVIIGIEELFFIDNLFYEEEDKIRKDFDVRLLASEKFYARARWCIGHVMYRLMKPLDGSTLTFVKPRIDEERARQISKKTVANGYYL